MGLKMAGCNFIFNINPLSGINKLHLDLTTSKQLNSLQSAGHGEEMTFWIQRSLT